MRIVTAQEFGIPLLSWARDQFAKELRSDFQRTRQYDGLRAKEHLAALQKQTPEHLHILSRVLPLEVFWEAPDAIKRRNELPCNERAAVEKLRADYNRERDQNWDQSMEILRRNRVPQIKNLFESAVKEGNILQKQIAKQRDWVVARAAPGEWGFLGRREWGQLVVSVNLSRSMTLTYFIGVSNLARERIRSLDHYLGSLGIGCGDWDVDSKDRFVEKFLKASDFGFWHAEEYETIIDRLI